MNTKDIWEKFLEIVKEKINPVSFNTWFKTISIHKIVDNKIIILVPMFIHKSTLGNIYYELIEETFQFLTGRNYDIEFVTEDEIHKDIIEDIKEDVVDNVVINNEIHESNLIPSLNFDNFVVGDTNRFAKTAALAVAENPGKTYNPLFIYGKSGLGKTHLMHAIGNFISQNSNLKVLYTTSDDFRDDFISISNSTDGKSTFDNSNYFKNKYRNIDVLIIDDIQSLVGAEKTQQEFFNTFNDLHMKGKQIIISSDRSPEDLKKLEERLRSRFTWGLPVDIFPPDFDLRCRILKDKIKYLNLANKMTDEAIEYIANNCDTDVRSLEGAINRLVAYTAMIVPEKITLEFVNEALNDYITKNPYILNDISNIQRAVADYYKITVDVLKGKKRSANIAYPRQVAMYLCRMLTDESFPQIGLEFGGRDHSTVIHACDKIESDLKTDANLKEVLNEIKSKL
ncbi:MAG: chromosomal replication initiator protein DnaA [Bacilli bacterium]